MGSVQCNTLQETYNSSASRLRTEQYFNVTTLSLYPRRSGTKSGGLAREIPRQVPASSKGSFWNLTLSWGGRLHFHEKSGKLNCRLSLYQLLSAVQERENRVLFRYLQCACDRLYGIKLNIEIMRKNSGLENGGFYERSKDWGDC